MKLGILSFFAPPEKGAVVIRICSMRAYFERKGIQTHIISPYRPTLHSGKYLPYVIRYKSIFGLLKIIRNFDLIIGTIPPIREALKAVFLCRLMKIDFISDIRDPWANYEIIVYKKQIFRYNKRLIEEKLLLKMSNAIFCVSNYLKEEISHKHGSNIKKKTIIVENGADFSLFRHLVKERESVRLKLNIPVNAIVIAYEGIVGGKELDRFLKTIDIEYLKQKNVFIIFIIILDRWSIPIVNELIRITEIRDIKNNCRWIGPIEPDEMPKYLSAADIGLNPLPNARQYCLPVKTFEYVGCGLMIAGKASEYGMLSNIVKSWNLGFVAATWEEFDKHFKELINNYTLYLGHCLERREEFLKRYSRDSHNKIAFKAMISIKKINN